MRKVSISKWQKGEIVSTEKTGYFHRWSVNSEHYHGETEAYPVAIVELEDGSSRRS